MKMKHKLIAKCVLIFSGIMLGMECQGLVIIPKTRTQISDIQKAMQIYAIDHNGKLPASMDELFLFASNNYEYSEKPLLKKEDIIDIWGEPIRYEREGGKYIIISSGPDKKMGTADDFYDGRPMSYVESWRAKHAQAIVEQETNAVQEVTAETVQPPVGVGKTQANRVPVIGTQPPPDPDKPAEQPKTTPWKLPLLIGIIATAGATMAWCCFRKRKRI